ncbi:unnamed protein product [Gordionus sp. m RMFG-2023]
MPGTRLKRDWSKSDFDDLETKLPETPTIAKRKRLPNKRLILKNLENPVEQYNILNKPWVDIWEQLTDKSLVIHGKKINEVFEWLDSINRKEITFKNQVMILTGPSGSGKSTLIKVLCQQKNIEIIKWNNNNFLYNDINNLYNNISQDFNLRSYSNYYKNFHDFILRATKYKPLNMNNYENSKDMSDKLRNVLLIEDQDINDLNEFLHERLKLFSTSLYIPIIIILSISNNNLPLKHNGIIDNQSIFSQIYNNNMAAGKSFLKLLKLPPITEKNVIKALNNMLTNLNYFNVIDKFCIENNATKKKEKKQIINGNDKFNNIINGIAKNCNGDLRFAINSLQFNCQTLFSGENIKEDNKLFANDLATRDRSLDLFHSLGKILYRKVTKELEVFTDDFSHGSVNSTNIMKDTFSLLSKLSVNKETFLDFLQYNQISFFDSCGSSALAASLHDSSFADHIYSFWEFREIMTDMALLIASHSYITHTLTQNINNENNRNLGWKPLNKPKIYTSKLGLNTLAKNKMAKIKPDLPYHNYFMPYNEIFTVLLPLRNLVNQSSDNKFECLPSLKPSKLSSVITKNYDTKEMQNLETFKMATNNKSNNNFDYRKNVQNKNDIEDYYQNDVDIIED